MGLLNSAFFCEEIVSWLIDMYPDRFQVFENTAVQSINLEGRSNCLPGGAILRTARSATEERDAPADAQLEALKHKADENAPCGQHLAGGHSVYAKYAVLCTNGYDNLTIEGIKSSIMNSSRGIMGFMIGCLDEAEREPMASAYFDSRWHDPDDGYYYLSSRAYAETDGSKRTLISVGGQDKNLTEEERHCYDFIAGNEEHYSRIESFYRDTIVDLPQCRDPEFTWSGLMGYTKNKVRLIGPDPADPSLIYNLGCNGIGILPAIYGGKRVARLIGGERLNPSIFDPNLLLRRAL
jgi:glycine/D-amino acid oxidase-like deaminating enzyme